MIASARVFRCNCEDHEEMTKRIERVFIERDCNGEKFAAQTFCEDGQRSQDVYSNRGRRREKFSS